MAVKFKYLAIICLFLTACNERRNSQTARAVDETLSRGERITDLNWPTGRFELKEESGVYTELWSKLEDNEFAGRAWRLKKKDTILECKMRLFVEKGLVKMNYETDSPTEEKDIQLRLTKHSGDLYVFENPFREFPSVMQYKFMGDTAVNIVQSGFEKGPEMERSLTLTKIN